MSGHYPLTDLAHSTGRNYFEGTELLIAVKAYFDGSEGQDDNGDKWLTLAGFGASDRTWHLFNRKWEHMLKQRYPVPPFIHMNPLVMATKPFERVVGWSEEKITALVTDAIDIMQNLNSASFRSFVCSVNISARKRLVDEGYDVMDPMSLCADMCIGASHTWHIESGSRELAYLFYDRTELFLKPFRKRWLQNRTPPGQLTTGEGESLFWDFFRDVSEVDMAYNPPMQAADMVAWGRSRGLSAKERPWKYLAKIMGDVIATSTAIITEDMMRSKSVKKPAIP